MSPAGLKIAFGLCLAFALLAASLVGLGLLGAGSSRGAAAATPAAQPQVHAAALASSPPSSDRPWRPTEPVASLSQPPLHGPAFTIVRLRPGARIALRATPGGRLLTTVGDTTEFGSSRTFGVVRTHGSWLGVLAPELTNGSIGWIRFDPAKMERYWTKYSLSADLSEQTLELRYGTTTISTHLVTVGGAGSETPVGRFAITDGLAFDASPFYGCCAMVTSGHQPKLPIGWIGGDRIAIHGTAGPVGGAESHGCLRATAATLHALMSRLPLGTPLFVNG